MPSWTQGMCCMRSLGRLHPDVSVCHAAWRHSSAWTTAGSRRAFRCYSSESDTLPPPDVRKLAQLAQIAVTDEEAEVWGAQIGEIVQWFDQLQAVDVTGVPPALGSPVDCDNLLREDTPRVYENRDALMSEVPDMEGSYVKVPKIGAGETQE